MPSTSRIERPSSSTSVRCTTKSVFRAELEALMDAKAYADLVGK